MYLGFLIGCTVFGGLGSLKLHAAALLVLSFIGIATASALGWMLGYPLATGFIFAIGGVVATQVGYVAGLVAQVWLIDRRETEPDEEGSPVGE